MFFEEKAEAGRRELNTELTEQQNEFTTISASDTRILLDLLGDMQCRSSRIMQIKMNEYLVDVTSAGLVFMLCPMSLTPDYVVQCVGSVAVDPPIRIKDEWTAFNINLENMDFQATAFRAHCMKNTLHEIVSKKLFERTAQTFTHFLIVPCFLPDKEQPQLYVVLVNTLETDEALEMDSNLVGECSRYCLPTLRNTMRAEEMRERHEKLKIIVSEIDAVAIDIGDERKLIRGVKKAMERVLQAECSAIFLKEDKHLVSKSLAYGQPLDMENEIELSDVKIPLGIGMTGISGTLGQVMISNDPKKEVIYCNVPTYQTRFRNTLSFPFYFKDEIYGVGEVYNKTLGKFTEADKVYAETIGRLFGAILKQCLQLRKVNDKARKKDVVAAVLGTKKEYDPKSEPETNRVMNAYKGLSLEDFTGMEFLPSNISEENSIVYIMAAFDKMGLIRKFDIRIDNLIRFLLYQSKNQRPYPFRNWFHSFCSFQFLYSLIYNSKLIEGKAIQDIEALAMLLASLCNGCGYRGSTHRFQLETGTVLASVYASPGRRNELLAIHQSLQAMNNPTHNFLLNVTPEDYGNFVRLFDAMVLNTDLADFVNNVQEFENLKKFPEEISDEDKPRFYQLLLVCSKISDHARIWEHAVETGDRLYQEFHRSKQPSYSTRIFDIPGINSLPMRAQLQSHFITSICIPAFRILQKSIPDTEYYLLNLDTNLKKLGNLSKQLKKREFIELGGETESGGSFEVVEDNN